MKNRNLLFFAALCFFLSSIEYAIPKIVPFFRLGLANLPIMLSLSVFSKKDTCILVFYKVFFQGLLSGTFFSYIFLFSLCGSFASCLAMMAVYSIFSQKKLASWISTSISGALANNLSTLFLAHFMLFGENTRLFAPVLLSISFFSSIFLGLFANAFCNHSIWWKEVSNGFSYITSKCKINDNTQYNIQFILSLILSSAAFITVTFAENFTITSSIMIFFILSCIISGNKIRISASIFMILSITMLELLVPNGKILLEFGKIKITQGALFYGLLKSTRLCSFVYISKFMIGRKFFFANSSKSYSTMIQILADLSKNISLNRKNFIKSIDDALLKSFHNETDETQSANPT